MSANHLHVPCVNCRTQETTTIQVYQQIMPPEPQSTLNCKQKTQKKKIRQVKQLKNLLGIRRKIIIKCDQRKAINSCPNKWIHKCPPHFHLYLETIHHPNQLIFLQHQTKTQQASSIFYSKYIGNKDYREQASSTGGNSENKNNKLPVQLVKQLTIAHQNIDWLSNKTKRHIIYTF